MIITAFVIGVLSGAAGVIVLCAIFINRDDIGPRF